MIDFLCDLFLISYSGYSLVTCFKFLVKILRGGTYEEHTTSVAILNDLGLVKELSVYHVHGDNSISNNVKCIYDFSKHGNVRAKRKAVARKNDTAGRKAPNIDNELSA